MNKHVEGQTYTMVVQRPNDGYGKIIGEPKIIKPGSDTNDDGSYCPKCKSVNVNVMQANVENTLLVGGKGVGFFVKCANVKCDWESEMMTKAL